MDRRQAVQHLLAVAVAPVAALTARAGETYPSRPVKIIVTSSAGGVLDVNMRRIAERLSPLLGQPVVIDNRPGASGTIGAAAGSKAPADGYTLTTGTSSALAIAPAVGQQLGFEVDSLQPITRAFSVPFVLLVNPSLGVTTAAELVALAKSRSGGLAYSSTGYAGTNHIAAEVFLWSAGIGATHVPYKGDAEALLAVLAGQVQFNFGFPTTCLPHLRAGKLRALLVTSHRRLAVLPGVPTSAEVGWPELELYAWAGFFVPRGTPPAITTRLHDELVRVLTGAQIRAFAEQEGSLIGADSPEEFRAFVASERAKFTQLVRMIGIRVNE